MPKGSHKRKLSEDDKAEIIRLYTTPNPDGTWTGVYLIARQFDVAPGTIRRILILAGVPTRTIKQAAKPTKPVVNLPPEGERPPACKCGCGEQVAWNQRKNKWNVYVEGHYRKPAPYKSRKWLDEQYTVNQRTIADIAHECGVGNGTVDKFMRKFGIPKRSQSESLALSGSVRGENNPNWQGGIADWHYSHNWFRLGQQIKERDEWTCQLCGKQENGRKFHVHHIDEDKLNNHPHNLISLCAKCHAGVHADHKSRQELRRIAIERTG